MRIALLACLVLAAALAAPAGAAPAPATIRPIPPDVRAWMTGRSWRPGCPVGLGDLRLVTVPRWDWSGRPTRGTLVVHRDVAPAVVRVFARLYALRFPIRRMALVDAYGASDYRSIEADNTSAFNCRPVDGTSRWSEHAYGRALDLNPIENPYVSGGTTSHRASIPYVRRRSGRGVVVAGGPVERAFASVGWGWGGRFAGSVRDYQHFSASGR